MSPDTAVPVSEVVRRAQRDGRWTMLVSFPPGPVDGHVDQEQVSASGVLETVVAGVVRDELCKLGMFVSTRTWDAGEIVSLVSAALGRLRTAAGDSGGSVPPADMEKLISAMLPDEPPPVPSQAKVLQARRNAQARLALLSEFGYLTAPQIAEGRSQAANRYALASSWRRHGRVFAVDYNGRQLFPGFQFDEHGQPLPVVAAVLAALPAAEMSEWELALWWTSANGWLDGERPVDRLDDVQALSVAAARLAEPSPL